MAEIEHALAAGVGCSLHAKVRARYKQLDPEGKEVSKVFDTTPGRMKIGELLPKSKNISLDLCNKLLTKREIFENDRRGLRALQAEEMVNFYDKTWRSASHHAFKAGISFGKDDMVIPETKEKLVQETRELAKSMSSSISMASSLKARSTTRSSMPGPNAPIGWPTR